MKKLQHTLLSGFQTKNSFIWNISNNPENQNTNETNPESSPDKQLTPEERTEMFEERLQAWVAAEHISPTVADTIKTAIYENIDYDTLSEEVKTSLANLQNLGFELTRIITNRTEKHYMPLAEIRDFEQDEVNQFLRDNPKKYIHPINGLTYINEFGEEKNITIGEQVAKASQKLQIDLTTPEGQRDFQRALEEAAQGGQINSIPISEIKQLGQALQSIKENNIANENEIRIIQKSLATMSDELRKSIGNKDDLYGGKTDTALQQFFAMVNKRYEHIQETHINFVNVPELLEKPTPPTIDEKHKCDRYLWVTDNSPSMLDDIEDVEEEIAITKEIQDLNPEGHRTKFERGRFLTSSIEGRNQHEAIMNSVAYNVSRIVENPEKYTGEEITLIASTDEGFQDGSREIFNKIADDIAFLKRHNVHLSIIFQRRDMSIPEEPLVQNISFEELSNYYLNNEQEAQNLYVEALESIYDRQNLTPEAKRGLLSQARRQADGQSLSIRLPNQRQRRIPRETHHAFDVPSDLGETVDIKAEKQKIKECKKRLIKYKKDLAIWNKKRLAYENQQSEIAENLQK